ncbi:DctP family TRAP transporter solute-binding subunit [Virgibacillus sp. MSP4-1]|uniref:DctP family TRAP transporter solute-binding subunit n=1 Tax=Virgibacillus sp. MSP4-1 TaxID=2700081 RepID=UPI0003A101D5|nr:DctP family TRAP transporter solute-binding subunit [Virgibacillus sp. MSP4-1]QHS23193.1 DctP family TRAP transporter solute-binding subunit [Virgibacillus sp. MSP4-1]
MKSWISTLLFLFAGMCTIIFFSLDLKESAATYVYDDEQETLDDQIVIRFSHVVAENTPKGRAVRRFADLVHERTDGKVSVEVYSNGILYSDQNQWQALKDGKVEMIAPATSQVAQYVPSFQVLDLPYAFPNAKAADEAYKGPIGQTLLKDLEQEEVKGLSFWHEGYKQVTNHKRPLQGPEDFYRLHFRSIPSPVIETQFEALHASTSILPFNKTYKNLEVEFINGQENTVSNIYTKKFYEVQDFITISNHAYLGNVVIINEEFWDRLSTEIQEAIGKSLDETTDWVRRHSIEINDQHMRNLRRLDEMRIHTLSPNQTSEWKQALEPVYKKTEDVVSEELMNEIYRLQHKYGYK